MSPEQERSERRADTGRRVLFLPGVGGDPLFWQGVGEYLPEDWEKRFLGWPGLGDQPARAGVAGFADLLRLAAAELTAPSVVVAQSMGGIIGAQLALERTSEVTHLVLVATSGGLDVRPFGAADWRQDFLRAYPQTARWVLDERPDLSGDWVRLRVPTLLVWGDADPISPLAVGRYLAERIHGARLDIVRGGNHDMGRVMPREIAERLVNFVSSASKIGRTA